MAITVKYAKLFFIRTINRKKRQKTKPKKKAQQQPNNKTGNEGSTDAATGYLPTVLSNRQKFNMKFGYFIFM